MLRLGRKRRKEKGEADVEDEEVEEEERRDGMKAYVTGKIPERDAIFNMPVIRRRESGHVDRGITLPQAKAGGGG